MKNLKDIINEIILEINILNLKLLKIYNSDDIQIKNKSDNSPVTVADMKSHEFLCDILEKTDFPILSEESEESFDRKTIETFWIIDPLDGTKDFIQKTDEFSVMIGLVHKEEVVLGIVSVPAKDKIYYAIKGQGAYLLENGKKQKLKVSETNDPEGARIVVSRNHFSGEMKDFAEMYNMNLVKCGSNGVKVGLLAEGKADFFFNPTDRMGIWDSCGPDIILKEAGGTMTGVTGKPIDYTQSGVKNKFGIVSSNTILHSVLIDFCKNNV